MPPCSIPEPYDGILEAGEAFIATSAEDSTVRLWDVRDGGITATTGPSSSSGPSSSPSQSSPRVAMCLCRCFEGMPVSSVVFGKGDANLLYCSAGGKVGGPQSLEKSDELDFSAHIKTTRARCYLCTYLDAHTRLCHVFYRHSNQDSNLLLRDTLRTVLLSL